MPVCVCLSVCLSLSVAFAVYSLLRASVHVQGGSKMAQFLLNSLTLSNINRFSKFFHCQNQEKVCNNIIAKDTTTPQVCQYTTL